MRADAIQRLRSVDSGDAGALFDCVRGLLGQGAEEQMIPLLERGVEDHPFDPRLWQLLGLAHRTLQESASAIEAFERAVALAPGDPLIAHSLARVTLDAGLPSTALFDRARQLAPLDAGIILGRAAALFAEGQPDAAMASLEEQLRPNPGWLQGHATLTRLRWMVGQRESAADSFDRAVAAIPGNGPLWRDYALTLLNAERHEAARAVIARARKALGSSRILDLLDASAASESGATAEADRLFAPLLPIAEVPMLIRHLRHLLRLGRAAEAARAAEGALGTGQDQQLWPYLATAWRMTGDPRSTWLEGDPRLIGVYDIADDVGPLDALADRLRALHIATHQPLDQSLRGGTQTDGMLFARVESEIRRLRAAILAAVAKHVEQLPHDPTHPTLSQPREPIRIAGSWSVRLTGEGRHIAHVHPAGWISSAFYVTLPDEVGEGRNAGWLSLGDQPELGLDLPPIRLVEPRPGRLVLFPSTMWHGTRPFRAGERMTVAFDVARPPR